MHLAPGRYPGPFVLPASVELVGAGESSVLAGEGAGPVVRAPEGVTVRSLGVQGGAWGLEAAGPVRLEAVRFGGQEEGAVRMEAGQLAAAGCAFEAGGERAVGVLLSGGARGEVRESSFTGAFRRGVEAREVELELESVRFRGAVTALYQVAGRVRLRHVTVGEGREAGLFAQRGSLRLEDVTVTGHEYGLQTVETTLEARGFTSVRAVRAGVVLIGSRGELEETVVLGSGNYGAMLLVGSDLVLRGVRVDGADEYGISVTRGRLRLQHAVMTRLTSRGGDSGDGLHLRDAEVEVEGLLVRNVAGVGVLGAQGSRVLLRDVSLESCQEAGVLAETLGRVTAEGLVVRGSGGPALSAMENGVLRVDALTARENAAGLVWADCQGGTEVMLGRVTGQDTPGAEVDCVARPSP
ncbi:right-handed parallel beta-helix repeat-containing protein [Archangium lipolyticum]|uniref:right-handed parallel beta-helix repeat-containing protein n=1 Tax=Archangium lipolyticum TaxID=2970465 RepID=UPI00214A4BBE|nr:right-handed parallel beta-helix repeat-containing protein [Archangium lipolyticum]